MNRKSRKSSRLRMDGRIKRRAPQDPARRHWRDEDGKEHYADNRAKRLFDQSIGRKLQGIIAKKDANKSRIHAATKTRRQLRKLRREVKQLQRAAE